MRQQLQVHLQRVGGVHKEGVQVQGRAGVHTPGGGSPMVGAHVRWVRHDSPGGRLVDLPLQELHLWVRGESLVQAKRLQEHLHG